MIKIFTLKGAFCALFMLLVLSFTSCNKNSDWIQMLYFYEESETLAEATKDSIISFNKRFVTFVNSHPGSENDDLYKPTRTNIDNAAELHGFRFGTLNIIITIEDEWEGIDEYYF